LRKERKADNKPTEVKGGGRNGKETERRQKSQKKKNTKTGSRIYDRKDRFRQKKGRKKWKGEQKTKKSSRDEGKKGKLKDRNLGWKEEQGMNNLTGREKNSRRRTDTNNEKGSEKA